MKLLKGNSTKAQFGRFLVVGGFTTALNYLIFAALYFTGINYLFASATGYLTGLVFGFILLKTYTFKAQGNWKPQAAGQFFVYIFSLALNLYVLSVLVETVRIVPLLSNVIAIAVSTITNFYGLKLFVFKK